MLGMLERNEIDCAISGFGLSATRSRAADYMNPVGFVRLEDSAVKFEILDSKQQSLLEGRLLLSRQLAVVRMVC